MLGSALLLANLFVPVPAMAVAAPPSLDDVKETIEDQTGLDIEWTTTAGRSARGALLRGTGTIGEEELSFTITCIVTYPPLRIRCTFSVEMTEEPGEVS